MKLPLCYTEGYNGTDSVPLCPWPQPPSFTCIFGVTACFLACLVLVYLMMEKMAFICHVNFVITIVLLFCNVMAALKTDAFVIVELQWH